MASLVEKYFSAADFAAIEAAVRQAESATSGEIAVELASRSRNWSGERLLCALAVTFVCMVAALLATRRVDWGVYYNTTQTLLWGGVGFVLAYFGGGRVLARTARRRAAVWRRALSAFHQMVPVRGRTGVLIFVSVEEGQAAVIADRGIAAKAPPDYWGGPCGTIVAGMAKGEHAEGIIRAIAAIGEELARHFPRMDDDVNELPDRPKVDE